MKKSNDRSPEMPEAVRNDATNKETPEELALVAPTAEGEPAEEGSADGGKEVDVAEMPSEQVVEEPELTDNESVADEENLPSEKFDKETVDAMIADAENRGYLRGRNERISELMRQPAVYERQSAPTAAESGCMAPDGDWTGESRPMILNNPRVSIWDL